MPPALDDVVARAALHASRGTRFVLWTGIGCAVSVAIQAVLAPFFISVDAEGRPIPDPNKEPARDGRLVAPDEAGGTNYRSPAWDPATGVLIVSAHDAYGIYFFKPEHGAHGWAGADYTVYGRGVLRAIDYQTGTMIEADPRWPDVLFNTTCLVGPQGVLYKYRKVNPWIPYEVHASPHDVPGYDEYTPITIFPGLLPEDFHLRVTADGFYRQWTDMNQGGGSWDNVWDVQNINFSDLTDLAQESPINNNFGPSLGSTAPKLSFVRQPHNPGRTAPFFEFEIVRVPAGLGKPG